MSSTISSIVSNFDARSLVNQLVALERQPVLALAAKKSGFEAKISTYGQIKSLLSKVESSLGDLDSTKILGMDSSSSDTSVLTSSATLSAVEGQYQIKINNIATSQTLHSGDFSSLSAEVADLTTVTTQKMRVQVGNGAVEDIIIDSSNNSLTKIKDTLNSAGIGITASVVDAGFTVDSSNKILMFNDGTERTATLTEGSYTSASLAAEIKRAMEGANGGDDTYTVNYNTTTSKFTIKNDSGNSNSLDLLFENASNTSEALLGYDATDRTALTAGSSLEGDSAVGGFRLFLSSDATGTNGRISIKVDEDNDGVFNESGSETDTTGLSKLAFSPSYDSAGAVSGGVANLTQSQAAKDASLVFDGLTITRSSNTVTDLITGVTLNLLKDSDTNTVNLKVEKKTSDISSNLQAFVQAYNGAFTAIREASIAVDGQAKILTGDSTARNILNSMRTTVTGAFDGKSLAQLGLSHSASGVLTLDSDILEEEISNNLNGVTSAIDKMAETFQTNLKDFINVAIPAVEDGIKSSIKSVNNRIVALNRRVDIIETGLRRKFLALEGLLTKFQRTSDQLTGALASLPKFGGGGK